MGNPSSKPQFMGDDGPMTSGDCARWLEAKFARHGELEDKASADLIRWQVQEIARLTAIVNGSRDETESPHDITCNYRRRPLFSDGCICKVVNKHEYELLERVFGDATDETIARHRSDMTSPVKTSTEPGNAS